MSVSFVGLGGMGGPIAGRLAEYFEITVFDLDPGRAAAVTGKNKVTIASSLADSLRPGGILFTMLPDDNAVRAVVSGEGGAAARLGPGGLHVNMSTVSPQLSRELAAMYEGAGGAYVAAPVWGRPNVAGSGALICSLAGPADAKERAKPYLSVLTSRIEDFGEEPHLANVVKIVGNFMVATAIESLAEALAVVEKHGLDRAAVADLYVNTIFKCPVYQTYGALVAAQKSGPAGFTAELGLKDLRLAREVASEVRAPIPFQNIIENRLISTIAKGRGKEDWSALSWGAAEDAGLHRPIKPK
jgi:3-hydroxyisobutyrate dehydrogenase-like beta-hydroxyacid dehydrogenase